LTFDATYPKSNPREEGQEEEQMNTVTDRLDGFAVGSGAREPHLTVIGPRSGWEIIDFREFKQYRDLFYFLVWRDLKVLYAQTILGFCWAIFQPLIQIVIFGIVFGRVAELSTDGIPYVLFSTVALIPWTYMSQAMTSSSESLIQSQQMLGKIYFPRLFFPLTPVVAKLVDYAISIVLLVGVLIYYRVTPSWTLILLPLFTLLMIAVPAGVGLWLSALAIRFRDVKHAMPFVVRMLIYTAPIVYSASSIPEGYRILYSLNPIVTVIEGYRSCLLGTPMQWTFIWPGIVTGVLLVLGGALYFRRMERVFVDVI
jgi:lipopolysaccharide transport system permease protein